MASIARVAAAVEEHISGEAAEALLRRKPGEKKKTAIEIADEAIEKITAVTPWAAIVPGWGIAIDALEAAAVKLVVHAIIRGLAKTQKAAAARKRKKK